MKFSALWDLVKDVPCFDFHLLVQAFPHPRKSLLVQLARWKKAGKVIGLRRGMYALGQVPSLVRTSPAALAQHLYVPSYLSGPWALAFHGLIPERAAWLTSVTPRVPRRFQNPFGLFEYRNLKPAAFFGFRTVNHGRTSILVAEPEKALLDHWHLTPGEWSRTRLEEMRYQNVEGVDVDRLRSYAARFRSPRLLRAVEGWLQLTALMAKGTVTI